MGGRSSEPPTPLATRAALWLYVKVSLGCELTRE